MGSEFTRKARKPTHRPASFAAKAPPSFQPVHSNLQLQRVFGNQAVLRLVGERGPDRAPPRPQRNLPIASALHPAEQDADRAADQVTRGSNGLRDGSVKVRRQAESPGASVTQAPPIVHRVLGSAGRPLDHDVRGFMEPKFGLDLSRVRIHVHDEAARSARAIGARAYTVGSDIVFGAGEYAPNTATGAHLLAHELAHVVQEGDRPSPPVVRRAIELRPPGRGEASAFDRRQELVDRLNATSAAVSYRLDADDRTLLYNIDNAGAMDDFDLKMIGFIDDGQVIPLRLITRSGLVGGVGVIADAFVSGYVDVDDLLGSSDLGFKLLLAHFITERLQVPDYARKIGSVAALGPRFNRAHARGRDAEAEVLQDVLGDPSVRHQFDELKPNGTTFVRAFRSDDEGYLVFWVLRGVGQRLLTPLTDIRVTTGGRTISLDDFIAARQAAQP